MILNDRNWPGSRPLRRTSSRVGRVAICFALYLIWPSGPAAAQNAVDAFWPQWRGPRANGVAPQGNPPTQWSESQNVKWKVKLPGSGSGTPVIWGDRIFLQTAIPTGKKVVPPAEPKQSAGLVLPQAAGQIRLAAEPPPGEGGPRRRPGGGGPGGGRAEKPTEFQRFVILALDRRTGATLWERTVKEEVPHEGHHRDHGFASHSPVTDGRSVFAWFGSRGLHCFTVGGELKWQKDLGRFRTINSFGEGNSIALHGDTLVINCDHEGEDFVVALDANTGKELWRNPRDEKTTWSTPLVVEHAGSAQVVVSASQRIRSYDLRSGKQLWECGGMTANVIPTPVSDFGLLYAISGFRGSALLAIKLGRTGDLTDSDAIAWRHGKSTPYVPSPLLYDGRLYFLAGNNPILSCLDAKTGEAVFSEVRLEGPSGFYASPVAAEGRIYLAGRNGVSLVLKQGTQVEVLATNKMDERFDASPAIVGKELFLRGHEFLYCVAEK